MSVVGRRAEVAIASPAFEPDSKLKLSGTAYLKNVLMVTVRLSLI
jgi:hypothetical protein